MYVCFLFLFLSFFFFFFWLLLSIAEQVFLNTCPPYKSLKIISLQYTEITLEVWLFAFENTFTINRNPFGSHPRGFKAWDENYFYSTKVPSQEDSNIFGLSRWPPEKVPLTFHDALERQFYFWFFTCRDLLPGYKDSFCYKNTPQESLQKIKQGQVKCCRCGPCPYHQQHILTRCWRGSLIVNGHSRKERKRSKLFEVIR